MPDRQTHTLSVADAIAQTWSANFSLNIGREDASFLTGIHVWLSVNPDPVLDEEQLRDIFRIVSEVANDDPNTLSLRATNAIARLRSQQLLVRADTAGIAQGGEYALTQLGKAIAEWFGAHEDLTQQSLEVVMNRIQADLAVIKAAAEQGGDDEHWQLQIIEPLRLTVTGLIELIDNRQRGMDVQQEAIRERIGQLLEAAWLDAVQSCEELLETTSGTLRELHRTLLHQVEGVSRLLTEIDELAEQTGQVQASEVIATVRNQAERLNAWGENRFHAWSEYYQTVHDFIRSVVQVDQDRAVRHRLREAIKVYGEPPWFYRIVQQRPYRHLRDPEDVKEAPKVERPRQEHCTLLEDTQLEQSLLERLEMLVVEQLERDGRANLLEILQTLLPDWSRDDIFRIGGELVERLIRHGQPAPVRELRWRRLGAEIELQDLTVYRADFARISAPKPESLPEQEDLYSIQDA